MEACHTSKAPGADETVPTLHRKYTWRKSSIVHQWNRDVFTLKASIYRWLSHSKSWTNPSVWGFSLIFPLLHGSLGKSSSSPCLASNFSVTARSRRMPVLTFSNLTPNIGAPRNPMGDLSVKHGKIIGIDGIVMDSSSDKSRWIPVMFKIESRGWDSNWGWRSMFKNRSFSGNRTPLPWATTISVQLP